jgi:trehalose 6-phosphate synthase
MNFNAAHWKAYREANMMFADVVASMCSAGDMVWVQDYHLMLLPMLLRTMISGASSQGSMVQHELGRVKEGLDTGALGLSKNEPEDEGVEMLENVGEDEPLQIDTKSKTPVSRLKRPGLQRGLSSFQQQEIKAKEKGKEGIRIGFFLHTPFPSSEIYRILPVRREILLGVLQCDLIGWVISFSACNTILISRFHTYDYARHFLSSCTRILGLETEPNGIDFEGRFAQVGTFPIGIDPYAFVEAVKKPSVLERTRSLEAKFEGKKVIIGVDRLDYIKGLPQKLQSFEVFLSQNPEWVEKVS